MYKPLQVLSLSLSGFSEGLRLTDLILQTRCSQSPLPMIMTSATGTLELTDEDCLFRGNGKLLMQYVGTQFLKRTVSRHRDEYAKAATTEEKMDIAQRVVDIVTNRKGRFVQVNRRVQSLVTNWGALTLVMQCFEADEDTRKEEHTDETELDMPPSPAPAPATSKNEAPAPVGMTTRSRTTRAMTRGKKAPPVATQASTSPSQRQKQKQKQKQKQNRKEQKQGTVRSLRVGKGGKRKREQGASCVLYEQPK